MTNKINQEEIKNVVEEVIKFNEIEFDFDQELLFENELNVSIEFDYIKSNVATDYRNQIRSKLTKLGYEVSLCTLGSRGEHSMYSSNSINTISFTVIYKSL